MQYKRRQEFVVAFQNDGTDERANEIIKWINEHGGKARLYVSNHLGNADVDSAIIKIIEPKAQNDLIPPGFWLVDSGGGLIFAMSNSVFETVYILAEDQ